ncbi:cobalt-precorrin-6A reductase [Actinomadura barringtoniae]|uniref:Cobalt-precorrin-6A reductase n=1 Tax=Actinomadura barringtoniae TaxID=1427535 RepID=A0A939PDC2_9ACTN|nr:cobalt-precorrin-6A reductase [Actinomadura barringtoniae]MBO2447599.1 cobalt-precorrin-6A reductase [Actinomadura barringtoniae]
MRVLVLGGTAEARSLAALLHGSPDVEVITSLAGRVAAPKLPEGRTRIGGFGGPAALAAWLQAERITALVDATHPFAERITAAAVAASERTGVPLLMLRRPAWTAGPDDDWRHEPSMAAAAANLPGERVFLTVGRTELGPFVADERRWFLIRSVDPPEPPIPPQALVVGARGPFNIEGELGLMREHAIDVLVTKNSGGEMAAAKLAAARRLTVPVVMIDRPPVPAVTAVATAQEAMSWIRLTRSR